jgi:hypothetical protein
LLIAADMRSVLSSAFLATSLTASLLAGCASDPQTGPYRLVTTVELPAEAIPPKQLDEVGAALRAFAATPGTTLLELAKEHGVTAVAEVRELPLALSTRLEGWITDEILKARFEGKTLPEYTDQIAGLARMALTRFAVESELLLDGDVRTHAITGLDLGPAGLDVRAAIEAAEGETLMQQPEIVVDAAGALSLGDQRFGLAYGAHAWQGIDAASVHVFGGAVREALGASIDCGRVASAVAAQCLLGVCVGNEPQLREVCEGGLDALVKVTRSQLAAVEIDELHFSQGTAVVVDEDDDGTGDRIADGVWQAELNLGLGLRHAPATFTGTR